MLLYFVIFLNLVLNEKNKGIIIEFFCALTIDLNIKDI